jgi:pentose-5-phosphate-3-epimerase
MSDSENDFSSRRDGNEGTRKKLAKKRKCKSHGVKMVVHLCPATNVQVLVPAFDSALFTGPS